MAIHRAQLLALSQMLRVLTARVTKTRRVNEVVFANTHLVHTLRVLLAEAPGLKSLLPTNAPREPNKLQTSFAKKFCTLG